MSFAWKLMALLIQLEQIKYLGMEGVISPW